MKKYLLLLIIGVSIFTACNSIPSDNRIRSSINEHFEYADSAKLYVIGKYKITNREYTINYSVYGNARDNIVLLRLDNGKWMLKLNDRVTWEIQDPK